MLVNFRGKKGAEKGAAVIAKRLGVGDGMKNIIRTVINELKELGVKTTNKLTQETVRQYTQYLQDRVTKGEVSQKTATDRISGLNNILKVANKTGLKVSAKDLGFHKNIYDKKVQALSEKVHNKFIDYLEKKYMETGDIRYKALQYSVKLQREVGLRFRESTQIKLLEKEIDENLILTKHDGTKNRRERRIELSERAKKTLLEAKKFAKENGWYSLIPITDKYNGHKNFAYEVVKDFRKETGEKFAFHMERHAYAQERYDELISDKGLSDIEARKIITEELGHSRLEITKVYL